MVGEPDFLTNLGLAPVFHSCAGQQLLLAVHRVVEAHAEIAGSLKLESRPEEVGGVKRAVDEALQPRPGLFAHDHRHIDEEAGFGRRPFLHQNHLPRCGRAQIAERLLHGLAPDSLGIHVEAERAAIALGIGLQESHRDGEGLSGGKGGKDLRPQAVFAFARVRPRGKFAAPHDRRPAEALGPAIIGIEPQFADEAVEAGPLHVVQRREQRGPGPKVG